MWCDIREVLGVLEVIMTIDPTQGKRWAIDVPEEGWRTVALHIL
jgi:hypothetical protein